MESTSRANGRQVPPEHLHDNTRFPISDSRLVNLLRMESIQRLRQGSLPHHSLPQSTPGCDLAALRDRLFPLQTDVLLQGNRSRMLALSEYMLANNIYPRSNWVLSDVVSRNSAPQSFLFPRDSVTGPYSLSPSVLDVQRRINHQSRGEGAIFQNPFVPSCPVFPDSRGTGMQTWHDQQPPPTIPFHGRQPSASLDLQLIAAVQAKSKGIHEESGKETREISCSASSDQSKKQKVAVTTEEASMIKCNSPESSKPYRKHQSENWKERYAELVEFRKQHGHCLVPNVFKENPPLAEWVKRQRYQFKLKKLGEHNSMSDDRIKMLEKLGFVWNSHDLLWEERLNDLKEYKEKHGDCNVPSKYTPNPSLAIWVKRQRRQYKFMTEAKVSTMTRMRIRKLNEIGFSWAARRATQDKEKPK